MKLSLVIPAYNEEGCIEKTVCAAHELLLNEKIEHEILVINDGSKDRTLEILEKLSQEIQEVRFITNTGAHGYGLAVRKGLENYTGDCVVVTMADASDDPADIVKFYRRLCEGYDCVFGTRFSEGGKTVDYPFVKLILNRTANYLISFLFQIRYNDVTNAFKMYRREVIDNLTPFLSHHFNLTVELPMKAIIRGHSYSVVPNIWINRDAGESKFKIKEMGSRYLFIMIYCFIEKWLSQGDYISNEKKGLQVSKKDL